MAAVEQPQVEMESPVPDADSEQLQAEKDGPSNEQVPQDFCVESILLLYGRRPRSAHVHSMCAPTVVGSIKMSVR